jgi:dolichol-phosphate mannosyltransferase
MVATPQTSGMSGGPVLSIIVPVRDEAPNILMLLEEIVAANPSSEPYEVIYVDDGSVDETTEILRQAAGKYPRLRNVRHAICLGKSAAIRSGVLAARGRIVVTIDGDGQNNPAYIEKLVSTLTAGGAALGLVSGQRLRRRGMFKHAQSIIANAVRRSLLRDGMRDTNCGLKAFYRDAYLMLPFFDGLHRFMPALMIRDGFSIAAIDVIDRPRHAGKSKYGVMNRLWIGIIDLLGVLWLLRRCSRPTMFDKVTDDAG